MFNARHKDVSQYRSLRLPNRLGFFDKTGVWSISLVAFWENRRLINRNHRRYLSYVQCLVLVLSKREAKKNICMLCQNNPAGVQCLTWMAWWVVWITELGLLFTNKTLLTGCMFPVAVWITDCWFGWMTEDCAWFYRGGKKMKILWIKARNATNPGGSYLMSICILLRRYQLNNVRCSWRYACSLVRWWRI